MKVLKIITLWLVAVATFGGCSGARSGSKADFEQLQHNLREGDLLFRRGIGVLGRAVTAADEEGLFSHVGIAVKVEGKWMLAFDK